MHAFTVLLTIGCAMAATVATAASVNQYSGGESASKGAIVPDTASDSTHVNGTTSAATLTMAGSAGETKNDKPGDATALSSTIVADKTNGSDRGAVTSAAGSLSRRSIARRFNWRKWGLLGLGAGAGAGIYHLTKPDDESSTQGVQDASYAT